MPGFLGAYPEAFFKVPREELGAVAALDGSGSYAELRKRWGVMRNSGAVHAAAHALDPIGSGIFDYRRLDAL